MKKFLALLLALVMVLSLAACGSSNTPAATEAPKTETPAATDAPVVKRANRLIYGSTTEISGDLGNAWWTNNATDKVLRDLIDDYATVTFDQFGAMVANNTVTKSIDVPG